MFDIAILDQPTELPLQAVEKVTPIAAAEPKKVKPTCEPEERLWKLSAQAVSPRFARIEFVRAHPVSGHRCSRSGQLLR
jgi:hypothetical protein